VKLRKLLSRLMLLVPASVLALAGLAPPANASLDMHMHFSNGIEGESTDPGHSKDVDVLAWSWGLSRTAATRSKAAGAGIQDLTFTKYADKSTPKLMQNLLSGGLISSVALDVERSGSPPTPYMQICMQGVAVQALSNGGSGGEDRLTENVTLRFGSFTYEYTPATSGAPPVFVSYDLSSKGFGSDTCP
jgi:type VI secretion system secreted protein Hcp